MGDRSISRLRATAAPMQSSSCGGGDQAPLRVGGERCAHFFVAEARLVLRVREVIALEKIDAEVAAPFVFFDGLETLGERLRSDFGGEIDEHFYEVLFDRLVGEG